ncbi:MAG: alpha/beta fold hydrolase [Pseudomonadota bacterium]
MRFGYADTADGQVHWRSLGERSDQPDLWLLHPAPFTGHFFEQVMPHLAVNRRVIAPDYPGYGGSFSPSSTPSIGMYATALLEAAGKPRQPIDVLGFHTGCLVAAEMALLDAPNVGRLMLIDVPAFSKEQQESIRNSMDDPAPLSTDIGSVTGLWQQAVIKRAETDGIDAAVALFADALRHGNRWMAAFDAAFRYPVDERFAELRATVHVVATQSGLLDASRRAAKLIPSATLTERLDIERSVMHESAERIGPAVLNLLD